MLGQPSRYDLLSGGGPPVDFNLDVASWLFDLSWDVYYDAPGTQTPSSAFGSTFARAVFLLCAH